MSHETIDTNDVLISEFNGTIASQDIAPDVTVSQPSTEFDEVAAYYEWLDDVRRRQTAAYFGLVATTSWEVLDYTIKQDQDLLAMVKQRTVAKRIAELRHVVPEQDSLRPELSEKISRLYYEYLHPVRTHYPDSFV